MLSLNHLKSWPGAPVGETAFRAFTGWLDDIMYSPSGRATPGRQGRFVRAAAR